MIENPPQPVKAIVFDAYGTLFDVHSVTALAESFFPTRGASLSLIWRMAQIDYTRLRTLCGQYRDFWAITGDALDFASEKLGLTIDAGQRERLMAQYQRLAAFPECAETLKRLQAMRLPLAILSNGTGKMLASAIEAASFGGIFSHVLSVDPVQKFKTAPEAYQLGPDALGCPAGNILFVSSNGWDVCGAAWFGYQTFWVNRAGNPLEHLDVRPNGEGRNLDDLFAHLA